MAACTCNGCGRAFSGLSAFDAHQRWDDTQPPGIQLSCYDPAALKTPDGEPRFRIDRYGRWGSTATMPPGAFTGRRQTAEPGPVHTRQHAAPSEPLEAQ
jgi:hypothetical protein